MGPPRGVPLRQVDLAVIGGGPAGSAAAMRAARRGLKVLVVDKARFPRDKLCGGLLSGRTAHQVAQVFGRGLEGDLFLPRQTFAFSWKGHVFSETTSPQPLQLTMRRDFDLWLLETAMAAGAEVHQGEREAKIDLAGQTVTLSDGQVIGWRALIGADGVNSAVARELFGSSFERAKIGFTLETEVPYDRATRAPGTAVQIDFGGLAWGYGWSFPKRHSVTVGLGGLEAQTKDFKAKMAVLLKDQATGPVNVKGHFIPFGDYRKRPGQGAVLLAGDAAGLVDPLTGEGIAYAIQSGALAADAVADWLGSGGNLTDRYVAGLPAIHGSIDGSNALARAMHARFVPAALKQRLISDARVQRKFFAILGGEAESSDVADFSMTRWLTQYAGRERQG